MIQNIKQKAMFWKDFYTTDILIWRRRGQKWIPELTTGVRFIYDSSPNAHKLSTDEEIPAIPLDYVDTQTNGRNFIQVAEVADSQYAPKDIDKDELTEIVDDLDVEWSADLDNVETFNTVEEEKVEVEKESNWNRIPLLNKSRYKETEVQEKEEKKLMIPFKPEIDQEEVQSSIIDNKDQKLNFWLDKLKEKEEKYTIPGFVAENKEMIMTVVTAVAVAIIMYASYSTWGESVPLLGELNENIPGLTDALKQQAESGGAPGE